jgi:hypothetical protein
MALFKPKTALAERMSIIKLVMKSNTKFRRLNDRRTVPNKHKENITRSRGLGTS